MGAWQYDEDMERLSMMMTLHNIGFAHDEIYFQERRLEKQQEIKDWSTRPRSMRSWTG